MIASPLVAAGPHPSIPAERRIFAPFVGSWDLLVTWYDAAGGVTRSERGEWHFDWVLEGRGIQDVWIVPPRDERGGDAEPYEYGTSLRFYDAGIDAWRSTWIGPMHNVVRTFVARGVDGTVVLDTDPGPDDAMRWVFSDIAAYRFKWRNSVRRDGEWRLQQDFVATRMR